MEPLISIRLHGHKPSYRPNERLRCEYQVDAVAAEELVAIEASVLWITDGKGDEDLGVHAFERRTPHDEPEADLRQAFEFTTQLPPSPLTYDGEILQIRWCVRVRAFLRRGKDVFLDKPFRLEAVQPARAPVVV